MASAVIQFSVNTCPEVLAAFNIQALQVQIAARAGNGVSPSAVRIVLRCTSIGGSSAAAVVGTSAEGVWASGSLSSSASDPASDAVDLEGADAPASRVLQTTSGALLQVCVTRMAKGVG
jgi:hypothetical protein